jgi:hypothetical protein
MLFLAGTAPALTLVKDGKPQVSIVVRTANSKDMTHSMRLALKELRDRVQEITGARPPVVTADKSVSGPVLLLGPSAALARHGVKTDMLKDDEWLIRSGPTFLAIVGRDVDGAIMRESAIGTYNGLIAFLEGYCGVRQYMPGKLGRIVPKQETLTIPDDLNVHGRKSIVWGVARYLGPRGVQMRWRWRGLPGVRVKSCGGHSWNFAFPVKEYFKEHPEYFALVSGKRTNHKWSSLCVSHPDVLRLKIDWAKKMLEDYDALELGHPDSYGGSCPGCQCEKCTALGDLGERCYTFHKKVAEAIRKWNPSKRVLITAYGPTKYARPNWSLPENAVVEVSNIGSLENAPEGYVPWSRVHDQFSVYVYFWLGFFKEGYAPHFSQAKVIDAFRSFKKHGVRMIYYCSQPMNWGLEVPQYLLDYRLRMDFDTDTKAVLDDFYSGFYGPAGEKMRAFFDVIEEAQATPVVDSRSSQNIYLTRWPRTRTDKAEALLDDALALAGEDAALRHRIEFSRPALQYIAATSRVFEHNRKYKETGSVADLEKLAKAVTDREAEVDAILKKQESRHYEEVGLPHVFYKWNRKLGLRDQLIYGKGTGLGGPFAIDFGTMLGFIRKHGVMETKAPRAGETVKVDAVLDEATWEQTGKLPMFHNEKGTPADVPTDARISYDDRAVYVAFTVHEPGVDEMEKKPYLALKKGAPWYEDCVEVFLGEGGESRKYCHFIVTFTNARYDGRGGFVTDELDPLYHRENGRWEGEWQSAARVDAAGKKWFVEIAVPWSTLSFGGPKAGLELRANFCRNRWTRKKREDWADLTSWSPTFAGLVERTRFGTVVLGK